jgi:ABC-type bacteriocin/lantibiotic exporter with double-glycine peptidase domain
MLLAVGTALITLEAASGIEHRQGQAVVQRDRAPEPAIWRTPENAGINCLYIQLRFMGYAESYGAFLKRASIVPDWQDVQSLCDIARRVGYPARLVRLTAKQLEALRVPVLAYTEPRGLGSGAFCLFGGHSRQHIDTIDGFTLRLTQSGKDEAFRAWTGYALVPETPKDWFGLARRYITLALASFVGWHFLICRRQTAAVASRWQT